MKHSEEHYRLYFGRNADYYIEIVKDLATTNKSRFNIPAFFLGLFWMMYRKLYLPILILIVILFVVGIIEEAILLSLNASTDTTSLVNVFSTIGWALFIGFFSNRVYVRQANKVITKTLALNLSIQETNSRIEKAGGTTLVPHIILLILILITLILAKL